MGYAIKRYAIKWVVLYSLHSFTGIPIILLVSQFNQCNCCSSGVAQYKLLHAVSLQFQYEFVCSPHILCFDDYSFHLV